MNKIKENINSLIIKRYYKNAYKIYRLITQNSIESLEKFRKINNLSEKNFLKDLDDNYDELNFNIL